MFTKKQLFAMALCAIIGIIIGLQAIGSMVLVYGWFYTISGLAIFVITTWWTTALLAEEPVYKQAVKDLSEEIKE